MFWLGGGWGLGLGLGWGWGWGWGLYSGHHDGTPDLWRSLGRRRHLVELLKPCVFRVGWQDGMKPVWSHPHHNAARVAMQQHHARRGGVRHVLLGRDMTA